MNVANETPVQYSIRIHNELERLRTLNKEHEEALLDALKRVQIYKEEAHNWHREAIKLELQVEKLRRLVPSGSLVDLEA